MFDLSDDKSKDNKNSILTTTENEVAEQFEVNEHNKVQLL